MMFNEMKIGDVIIGLGGLVFALFLCGRILIDRYFAKDKENKQLHSEKIDDKFTYLIDKFDRDIRDFNKDLDGLGDNIRNLKSMLANFQNTIATVGVNHEKLSIRIEQIEMAHRTLDQRIRDVVSHEILKTKA